MPLKNLSRTGNKSGLNPYRAVAVGFLVLIALGTAALSLPFASRGSADTSVVTALFTVTSAVTMTGLVVVDTGSYWSPAGQAVIAALIQVGGFGVMSLASLAGMLLTGRIGLRARLNTRAENRALDTGDVGKTLLWTLAITVICEVLVMIVFTVRFSLHYSMPFWRSLGEGIFYAISSFNNAGFALRDDSLVSYVGDAWIIVPIVLSLITGGLGYPVVSEIVQRVGRKTSLLPHRWRNMRRKMSVTARVTIIGTITLIVTGVTMVAVFEWNNALADLPLGSKALAAVLQGVTPRTAGFNSVDYGEFHVVTLMGTDILMFIGGGSAGTAGGIKITTVAVLFAAIVAEVRGRKETTIGSSTIEPQIVRQALTVVTISAAAVVAIIGSLRFIEPNINPDRIVFEVVSAFGTVGLSTGITADLTDSSKLILCSLMYLGRIGPVTMAVALARKASDRRFTYPKERPYIG
ncbi:TrkH family potassium uptake protein [Corynebacterium bovis]|uniref:TrkH family potassium uptake protein n=1 Tax=Corynebacterium bovis TaxID=36808 RepID=UPI003138AFB2